MLERQWVPIQEFPEYSISNYGEVVNETTGRLLRESTTIQGAVKVNLHNGEYHTRSVKVLVAEAFVPGQSVIFNTPIHLDGDQKNNRADNLMWRPRWFAWKYTRQMSDVSEVHLRGPIRDIDTREMYLHVYEAATMNGLLFKDIWRCLYNFDFETIFPTGQRFEFVR